jgi:23S rRNA (adenine2503-C2)-methyltransferase
MNGSGANVQPIMKTLSTLKMLRINFRKQFEFNTLFEDKVQHSLDGTIKTRWLTHDGHRIESVLIPVPDDNPVQPLCVSTQVGCSLTCSFCATGKMGREAKSGTPRNFRSGGRSKPAMYRSLRRPLTNVVYMGMGEPRLTYEIRCAAWSFLHRPYRWDSGRGPCRITVSTAGIAKMILKLADDGQESNLALSLHAADDIKRNEIMPINESNNLAALMESLEYFYLKTKGRISYEYIAFERFNDTPADAARLVQLCRKKFPVRVNIIEYNPVDADFLRQIR